MMCGFSRLDVLYGLCERAAVCMVLGAIRSGYVQASHTYSQYLKLNILKMNSYNHFKLLLPISILII